MSCASSVRGRGKGEAPLRFRVGALAARGIRRGRCIRHLPQVGEALKTRVSGPDCDAEYTRQVWARVHMLRERIFLDECECAVACMRACGIHGEYGVQLATLFRTVIELCFSKRSGPELILTYLL